MSYHQLTQTKRIEIVVVCAVGLLKRRKGIRITLTDEKKKEHCICDVLTSVIIPWLGIGYGNITFYITICEVRNV